MSRPEGAHADGEARQQVTAEHILVVELGAWLERPDRVALRPRVDLHDVQLGIDDPVCERVARPG